MIKELILNYFDKSNLSFIKTIPFSQIVFDERAAILCKYGCKNYNRKYSCPPQSSSLFKNVLSLEFKYATLFATTNFIPDNLSWGQKRNLNIQKELEIQRISKEISELLINNNIEAFVLSGGACKRCRDCSLIEDASCKKPYAKQVSMEAVGIDCQITMHKAGFDFSMPNIGSINRCGCILSNEKDLMNVNIKRNNSNQKFNPPNINQARKICTQIKNEYINSINNIEIIKTSEINISNILCPEKCSHRNSNYSCPPFSEPVNIDLWNYAIVWSWKENSDNSYNDILKQIHSRFFSLGYYFALSIRDCYCDECKNCKYTIKNASCVNKKLLSPSLQSQGIDPSQFGEEKIGIELI